MVKTIDWDKWSSIAEILSAVAILVTLIYLAIQTLHLAAQTELNAQAIRSSSAQGVLDSGSEALSVLLDHPEIVVALLSDDSDLTGELGVRIHTFLSNFARAQENIWRQHELGTIDESQLRVHQSALVAFLGFPSARYWWNNVKDGLYDEVFVASIDSQLGPVAESANEIAESLQGLFRPPQGE